MNPFAALSNFFLFSSNSSWDQEDNLFSKLIDHHPSIYSIESNSPSLMPPKAASKYYTRTWDRNTILKYYGSTSSTHRMQFNGTLKKKPNKRN